MLSRSRLFLLTLASMASAFFLACPARAAPPCQHLTAMSPDEINSARDEMIANAPVRFAETVRGITLEERDDARNLAPHIDAGRRVILIPTGFRKLQCQLVLLQFYLHRQGNEGVFDGVKNITDQCFERARDVRECILATMDLVEITNLSVWERMPAEDKRRFETILQAAFRHILLHEVAHLVLSHRDGRSRADEALQELEADEYAVVGSLLTAGPPMGAFSTFSTLSLLDNRLNWSQTPHQSSACRASSVQNVISRLHAPMRALMVLQHGSAADFREARNESQTFPENFLMNESQLRALRLHPCRGIPAERVDALRRDLMALVNRVDALGTAIPQSTDAPGMLAFIRILRAVPISTAEAARVRESVISVRLFSGATSQLPDHRPFNAVADQAAQGDDHLHWTSADYARYLYLRAIGIFANSPAGSSVVAVVEETRTLTQAAVSYNPRLTSAHFLLSEVQYMSGRCDEAVLSGQRALATATDPHHGNSEVIGLRAELYRVRGCSVAQQTLTEIHRRRAGWR